MNLSGNKILLTGGTSGVGLALLHRLHTLGNRMVVIGRNKEKIAALSKSYPDVRLLAGDLSSEADLQHLLLILQRDHTNCNLLINNAGIQYNYELGNDTDGYAKIEQEIQTNLTSVVQLCQAMIPSLKQHRQAAIINITSGLALSPKRSAPVYCATKAGVRIFTKALRYQLAGSSVRVIDVMLPLVDTPMTAGRGRGKISPEQVAEEITRGLQRNHAEINVGKVKPFRFIYRLAPALADRILKNG